ncbi:hypothetical protein UlMin_030350 [Ulmus minor]
MEEEESELFTFNSSPSLVSLSPFSPIPAPSSRRLSACFARPSRPVAAARRLAWVSLQGRLVNAEEASSARAIKGGLDRSEAVAWELFSPFLRFLVVAVIGVAVAESKKNRQICKLKKSVQLRDEVLSSMQKKLDTLCEQLNNVKDYSANKSVNLPVHEVFGSDKPKFVDCGCWLCDQHHELFHKLAGNSVVKPSGGDDILQYKGSLINVAEQEERRMSDLSDWASSVTSAAELQMNNLSIEHDIYNLKRDCEDKNATIKELTTLLRSSDSASSKRISEMEDIIKRKNSTITRLKKDLVVLEQKVVSLVRLRRSSSSKESPTIQVPHLTDNLLYDMDSTTSPSSSDSDNSPKERPQIPVANSPETPAQNVGSGSTRNQKSLPAKASSSMVRPNDKHLESRSASPLQEISMNRRSEPKASSNQRQSSSGGDPRRSRRRYPAVQKDKTSQKRWV